MDGSLTEAELQTIKQLYETRYEQFGNSHRTVGWGSIRDQVLRFDMLCRGLDLTGKTILDIGCGLGDIVPYLDIRYPSGFKYTGIDLAPSLVKAAQQQFAQPNISFICGDMDKLDESEEYDVVLLSGALSYRVDDNVGHAKAMLKKLFRISKEVISVNFLSDYVDYQEEKNFHYSPEDMFHFAKTLTKWVALFSDYPLWEFTIQLRHSSINNSKSDL